MSLATSETDLLPRVSSHRRRSDFILRLHTFDHRLHTSNSLFPKQQSGLRVLLPDGSPAAVWNCLMLLAVVYEVLTIPYLLAFEDSESDLFVRVSLACFCLFVLDIGVNFNVGFYTRGRLCEDRKAIALRYMQGWFPLDLIATFPYNWLFQSPLEASSSHAYNIPALIRLAKISRLLRSFRLLRLAKLGKYFLTLKQHLSSEGALLVAFFSLLTLTGLLAHWAACGFYLISQLSDSPNTWVHSVHMEEADSKDKYVMALYWAVTTLTTTGFGDVVPANTTERIYGITLMMLAAGLFSLLIGKVGSVLAQVGKEANQQRELILEVSRSLKRAAVPESVRFRALRYLDYKWTTRKHRKAFNQSVLSELSAPLRSEVSQHIFGSILNRAPFLSQFEYIFLCQLGTYLSPEIYAVKDEILSELQVSTDMYFLENGKVEMYHAGTGAIYRELQAGDHFGELSFITNAPRSASARCSQYAEVLKLPRDPFLGLVQLSPSAQYSLQVVKDALETNNLFEVGISCYLCREFTHLAKDCERMRVSTAEKEEGRRMWLEMRKGGKKVTHLVANFGRRQRSVKRSKGYNLRNVKSLPPRSTPQIIITHAESSSSSSRPSPQPSPPPLRISLSPTGLAVSDRTQTGRRFSIFRGVKTYSLQSGRQGLIARNSESDLSPAR